MMKRLLLAASILALTAGGAFAQGNYSSSPTPAPSPAAPPPAAAPAPAAPGGAMGQPSGSMGQAPKANSMGHASTMHATSGTKVKDAQQALQQAGLYKGKVDGKFGPQTKSAVKEFQKENGLKQTARLDSATMKKLTEAGGAGGGMPSGGSTTH